MLESKIRVWKAYSQVQSFSVEVIPSKTKRHNKAFCSLVVLNGTLVTSKVTSLLLNVTA